jgi:hypothetical protein
MSKNYTFTNSNGESKVILATNIYRADNALDKIVSNPRQWELVSVTPNAPSMRSKPSILRPPKMSDYMPADGEGYIGAKADYDRAMKRYKQSIKPKRTKSNWVPNMRRLSTKKLSDWLKAGSGTPKQRRLAYSVIQSRRR